MKELKNKFDMGFNEINHKIDMKVKKDCQVIISPLVQSMSGFRQAIFSAGEYVSDWVADVKKGLNSLYGLISLKPMSNLFLSSFMCFFHSMGNPFGRGIGPIR
jgi:hypothetical protein